MVGIMEFLIELGVRKGNGGLFRESLRVANIGSCERAFLF